MSPSSQPSSPLLSRFLPHKPSSPSSPKRQDEGRMVDPPSPTTTSHAQPSAPSAALDASAHHVAAFALPFLPEGRTSSSSLLEAVVGRPEAGPTETPPATVPRALNLTKPTKSSQLLADAEGQLDSPGSRSHDTESWSVLSEVSVNTSESRGEEVAELQKKVDKRRSHLPHLESQLKALEAKIKEAEERLAKAQVVPSGPVPDTSN